MSNIGLVLSPTVIFHENLEHLGGVAGVHLHRVVSRMGESDADLYSLQTVNLPDALAGALVKTAEYRYPRPSALQEALFYTHPSVEWRVRIAMEWKKKQMEMAK